MLYVHIKEKESEMTIKSTLSKTYGENLIKQASSPTSFNIYLFFLCSSTYISFVHSYCFSYFIAPHSYIPPGSGLGTRRLTLKYHFLKYIIHLVQCYLIVACILLRWLSMFFRTFSAVLSSLCFAPLMTALFTVLCWPLNFFLLTSSLVTRPTHTKPHGSGLGTRGISFDFKLSFEFTH